MRKPNILLIMTDQQRADHVGFGGNATVRTPHLDGIAQRGVVFDKAYVANPICMPNRASIMTGMMPSRHGTIMNGVSLDWGINTYARVAREAGYATAMIGKSHLQIMNDSPDDTRAILGKKPAADGRRLGWEDDWDRYEDMEAWRAGDIELPEDFYGFDYVRLAVFHSDMCSGHYLRWLIEQGVDPESIQGREVAQASNFETQQVWQTSTPEELYPTTYVANEACDFLARQKGKDQPFLLKVSFPDPHHPFTPPGKYWDMYDPADVELPQTFWDEHKKSPPAFRHYTRNRGDGKQLMMPFSPTEEQFRRMVAAEYGMITMIDDNIGRVLSALENSGKADDTIIVFTSDHGDMFGDHGLMLKVGMHYEGCIRVPLVIAGPGIAAGRSSSLASSTDIAPTLIAAIGEAAYTGIYGEDLSPLLADNNAKLRDSLLIEEEHIFPDQSTGKSLNLRSVITEQARLTIREGGEEFGELFDFMNDPLELNNLYEEATASQFRADMFEQLAQAMMQAAHAARKPAAQA